MPTAADDDDPRLTFEEIRTRADAALGDVADLLRSDWRPGTGPSTRQAVAAARAKDLIAQARLALDRAGR